MKTVLATVNITPDGRIQANPEMLVMPKPNYCSSYGGNVTGQCPAYGTEEYKEFGCDCWGKEENDKQWHSGLVDFEDKERVLWILFQGGKVETDKPFSSNPNEVMDGIKRILKPGTYTVELPEFGVVKQCRNEDYDEWKDDKKFFSNYPFSTRRVLRFKV